MTPLGSEMFMERVRRADALDEDVALQRERRLCRGKVLELAPDTRPAGKMRGQHSALVRAVDSDAGELRCATSAARWKPGDPIVVLRDTVPRWRGRLGELRDARPARTPVAYVGGYSSFVVVAPAEVCALLWPGDEFVADTEP